MTNISRDLCGFFPVSFLLGTGDHFYKHFIQFGHAHPGQAMTHQYEHAKHY